MNKVLKNILGDKKSKNKFDMKEAKNIANKRLRCKKCGYIKKHNHSLGIYCPNCDR
jgi:rubrerythrin